MILALISIACFSDVSNSLQAMLICARISNAIGTFPHFLAIYFRIWISFPSSVCLSMYSAMTMFFFFILMEVVLAA